MKIKKILFMIDKFKKDLATPRPRYPIASNLTSEKLNEYYFLFTEDRVSTGKDQALINKFDENGIPINKTYIDVTDKDYVYFPISIGQMGISVFHTYLDTKSTKDRNRFLNFVNWFYDNAENTDKLGARWLTDVPLPQYKNPGPWQSAFSQARAINILLRGWQITNKDKYLDMSIKALKPFTIPVNEGGVTRFTSWGSFYEEYTSHVPTMVLNGMIFALFGLYDFVRVVPENQTAEELFDNGIETLEKILPEYNLGFWSRYNLCQADWHPAIDPATIQYQRLHISQLKVLYRITGSETFIKYINILQSQDNLWNAFRTYFVKYKSLKKIGRL